MNTDKYLNKFKAQIKNEASFDRSRQEVSGKLDGMKRGPVAKIWDQVLMLWGYVRDRKTPWTAKILPLAGLVYLISPLDAIPDVLFPIGLLDDVAVILLIVNHVKSIIRSATDAALDAASAYARRKGVESLVELNAKAYKNLIVSAALNGTMLLCAVLSVIFLHQRGIGILIAALVNYFLLGRALFNVVRFFRAILVPYRRLIAFALPVFFNGLRMLKSLKLAIQVSIVAVVDYFYEDKVPSALKIVYKITSDFGLIKNRDEINDMAANDFYPLLLRFLRMVLLYNVLLFTVCYGLLIFIAKFFIMGTMLGMSFVDLYLYPFVYIAGIVGKW
jgi:uncharacterized membrane protein YkvA (DUF1232 family)